MAHTHMFHHGYWDEEHRYHNCHSCWFDFLKSNKLVEEYQAPKENHRILKSGMKVICPKCKRELDYQYSYYQMY